MPGFYDVYVLSPDRSRAGIRRFLDHFLPEREEVAEDYAVPWLAEPPDATFATAEELLAWLEEHPEQPHGLYWASQTPGDPRFAMVFPTADGQAVYGLAVEYREQDFLIALKAHLGSTTGYVDFETPPPETAADFEKVAADLGGSSPTAGPGADSR